MSTALQYNNYRGIHRNYNKLLYYAKSFESFHIFSTGDRCLDDVPVITASVTSAAVTDSNLPTPDGTDTTVNQTPGSIDSGTSNPDFSQNDATTKGEFLNNAIKV